MKKILVATDLSERSDRAVRRAMRIAKDHQGTCLVLHVVDDAMPPSLAEKVHREAQVELERFVEAEKGETEATVEVLTGDPVDAIPGRARSWGADLIVLGLHRPRAMLDYLRETTMERLVRLLDTPVLLVHEHADHDYRRVLAPVSFSPACAAALKTARVLAPEADISAFHAIYLPFSGLTGEQPGGAMDRELSAEAETARIKWREQENLPDDLCEVTTVTGSFYDMLASQLEAHKPDLIALGAHTRGGLAPYTLGAFAAKLVRNPPTDLLLAQP